MCVYLEYQYLYFGVLKCVFKHRCALSVLVTNMEGGRIHILVREPNTPNADEDFGGVGGGKGQHRRGSSILVRGAQP